jgi:hypothetical protein
VSLLSDVLGAVAEVQGDDELNALRYRHTATWSDGMRCRFSVKDPGTGNQDGPLQQQTDRLRASLRTLKVHPDDPRPTPGAWTSHQAGQLHLGSWTDPSDFTGQCTGVCRLVDARAYPESAQVTGGDAIQLHVEALSGTAVQAGSGAMDVDASGAGR